MNVDIDIWCEHKQYMTVIDCTSMYQYTFAGIGKLAGCTPRTMAAQALVDENCHWYCKMGRPFARCKWSFDPTGNYGIGGTLELCEIRESCNVTQNRVVVEAGCKPIQLWSDHSTTASTLAQVRVDLNQAQQDHAEAQLLLEHALASFGASSRQAISAAAKLQQTEQELNASFAELNTALDDLQNEAEDHNMTRDNLTALQVQHTLTKQELLVVIADLEKLRQKMGSETLQHAATARELAAAEQALAAMEARATLAEAALRVGYTGPLDNEQLSLAQAFTKKLDEEEARREELEAEMLQNEERHRQELQAQEQQLSNEHQLLGDEQAKSAGLTVVIVALALVVCLACLLVGALVFSRRRLLNGHLDEASLAEAGSVMVVGRPVDQGPGAEPGEPVLKPHPERTPASNAAKNSASKDKKAPASNAAGNGSQSNNAGNGVFTGNSASDFGADRTRSRSPQPSVSGVDGYPDAGPEIFQETARI